MNRLFVVTAKRTQKDIEDSLRYPEKNSGIVIAQFVADEHIGRPIAEQIAENWCRHYFPDQWEALGNGQYRLKGDPVGVAANILEYEVRA